uniref:Uncharacterized protein n=1 Tax=Anopheles farauti TaxID=69004 RepID=A0A182R160_9DIPT
MEASYQKPLDPALPRSVTDRDASSTIRQRSGLAGASRCYPQKADGANGTKNGEVVNDRATSAIGLEQAQSRNELRRRKLLLQLELLELEKAEEEVTTSSKMKEAEAWYQATDRLGASAKDKKYYPSACAMRTGNPPPGYDRRWTWDPNFRDWVQSLEDSVQKSEQNKYSALGVQDERTVMTCQPKVMTCLLTVLTYVNGHVGTHYLYKFYRL